MTSANHGQATLVRQLLPNVRRRNATPSHVPLTVDELRGLSAEVIAATSAGNLATVRALVTRHPVLRRARDAGKDTLVHIAVRNKQIRLLRYLLDVSRADVNARNAGNETPMMVACSVTCVPCLTMLETYGGKVVDACLASIRSPREITKAYLDTWLFVLQRGANPNADAARHRDGSNPMHTFVDALAMRSWIDMTPTMWTVFDLLAQKTRDKTQALTDTLRYILNTENDAQRKRRLPLLDILVKHGLTTSEINARPSHVMRSMWQPEVVRWLLRHGANPNLSERGDFPLHFAVQRNDVNLVRMLLHHGADPNVVDDNGRTPLVAVAVHHFGHMVQSHASEQRTILQKELAITRLLLKFGARTDIRDSFANKYAVDYYEHRSRNNAATEDAVRKLLASKPPRQSPFAWKAIATKRKRNQ